MQDVETEKRSYGFFERVLYLFIIPIMFTAILTVVLLSIFDYDVMNSVLKAANKVPVLEKVIPNPIENEAREPQADGQINEVPETADQKRWDEELEALSLELMEREADIQILSEQIEQKNAKIESLVQQIEELETAKEQLTISEEEYRDNIRRLAGIYADMMPSRAAAIMQNLTLSEQVLMLSEMKKADQVRILEKMSPQAAAEASILLKDEQLASDMQIQALQERLHQMIQSETVSTDT